MAPCLQFLPAPQGPTEAEQQQLEETTRPHNQCHRPALPATAPHTLCLFVRLLACLCGTLIDVRNRQQLSSLGLLLPSCLPCPRSPGSKCLAAAGHAAHAVVQYSMYIVDGPPAAGRSVSCSGSYASSSAFQLVVLLPTSAVHSRCTPWTPAALPAGCMVWSGLLITSQICMLQEAEVGFKLFRIVLPGCKSLRDVQSRLAWGSPSVFFFPCHYR